MKWNKIALSEITSLVKRGVSPKYTEEEGYVVINQKCVRNNYVSLNESRLTTLNKKYADDRFLLPGDVLVNSTGTGTLGRTARFKGYDSPVLVDSHVTIVRPNESVNSTFLAYALALIENVIESLAKGATNQTELSPKALGELEVPLPPLPTQQKIASILSAYDDLIENNLKRIALLEKAARLLYEEWFVRLRFPGHEHTNMVDGVPEGWEKLTIRKCTDFLSRGISPKYDEEAEGIVINQKCVRNNRVNVIQARNQSKEVKAEKQVYIGDVLVNSTGTGTLGRVAQVWQDYGKCTVDSHITIVRPKETISKCWFGYQLSILEPIFENMGEGATNQKELGRYRIGNLKILVPNSTIQRSFEDFVVKVPLQINQLISINQKLKQARDILLPKLINGEITV